MQCDLQTADGQERDGAGDQNFVLRPRLTLPRFTVGAALPTPQPRSGTHLVAARWRRGGLSGAPRRRDEILPLGRPDHLGRRGRCAGWRWCSGRELRFLRCRLGRLAGRSRRDLTAWCAQRGVMNVALYHR
jgi:hypothetical protein